MKINNACFEGGMNMQYEQPRIEIVKFEGIDIICLSNVEYGDDDGGFA